MSGRVVLFCEGSSDRHLLVGLAERVLLEHERLEWMHDAPEALPKFTGLLEHENCQYWKRLDETIQQLNLNPNSRGGFGRGYTLRFTGDGKPVEAYASAANKALLMVRTYAKNAVAVILFVDADKQPERRKGLEQARENHPALKVCIGVADPKSECWVLAGFEAKDNWEKGKIKELHKESGIHPVHSTYDLREREASSFENAKHVLEVLTQNSFDRKATCWKDTTLEVLHKHGKKTGLSDFLSELEERLARAFL